MVLIIAISLVIGVIFVRIMELIEEHKLLLFNVNQFRPGVHLIKLFGINLASVFAVSAVLQLTGVNYFYYNMHNFIHVLVTIFTIFVLGAGITILSLLVNDILFKPHPISAWKNLTGS